MLSILRPFLIFLIILNVGYAAWVLTAKGEALPKPRSPAVKSLEGVFFRISLPPLEHYEQLLGQRNIFSLNSDTGGTVPDGWQNLKLIGLMFDQGKQAILKNLDTNETFFVREEEIIREARIKQIMTDKVIVDDQGRLFEIVR